MLESIKKTLIEYKEQWGHEAGYLLIDAQTFFEASQEAEALCRGAASGNNLLCRYTNATVIILPNQRHRIVLAGHPGDAKAQAMLELSRPPSINNDRYFEDKPSRKARAF